MFDLLIPADDVEHICALARAYLRDTACAEHPSRDPKEPPTEAFVHTRRAVCRRVLHGHEGVHIRDEADAAVRRWLDVPQMDELTLVANARWWAADIRNAHERLDELGAPRTETDSGRVYSLNGRLQQLDAVPSPVREGGDDGRAFVAQCRSCGVIVGVAMERDATGYDEQDWHETNAAFMTRAAERGRRLLSLPEREWRPRLGQCRCPSEEAPDAV